MPTPRVRRPATAVLADGKTYQGMFADGRSFPDPVWLVSFPAHATATLIFRDAAGQVVATLHGAERQLASRFAS